MRSRSAPLIFCILLLSALIESPVHASVRHLERDDVTGHVGSTREEILAKRERRKKEFSKKLEEYKKQLDDHNSGRRRLANAQQLERLQKKVKAYEEKLGHLNKEIDDRHIQRLLDREEMLNEVHRERILSRSEL
mmetsp:Transcript_99167/g.286160  ORF Transcript_99167/g.286160 Transcript_99167/m.286160 type:complete len:135 (+) Transcript_99167:278-682(+)|eukprot:CAMPEP_0176083230 /NCGR_PEP_ID=MMETSP0120_2-20121206/41639_1 /TAXON_ID=160619 /ORGANISM="Kryptoperidinium foliaceum, Strain CCMP 1326" /LENGTH=134 /DNA_ID=CAMNT_0017417011 /DNA_START=243 /DNA_END=647 /DNA_ORIENTATION=-